MWRFGENCFDAECLENCFFFRGFFAAITHLGYDVSITVSVIEILLLNFRNLLAKLCQIRRKLYLLDRQRPAREIVAHRIICESRFLICLNLRIFNVAWNAAKFIGLFDHQLGSRWQLITTVVPALRQYTRCFMLIFGSLFSASPKITHKSYLSYETIKAHSSCKN